MTSKRLTPTQRLKDDAKKLAPGMLNELRAKVERRVADERLTIQSDKNISRENLPQDEAFQWLCEVATGGSDSSKPPYTFETFARFALGQKRWLGKPYEDAINAAFEKFKLDRENALNWRLLLGLLAHSHFGDPRNSGRGRLWTSERYCTLLEDVDQLKARNPSFSNRSACFNLKNGSLKARYAKVTNNRLYGAFKEARNPLKNPALAVVLAIVAQRKISEPSMSEKHEKKMISELGRKHADVIGRRWREQGSDKC